MKIRHLGIVVKDLEKSLVFYRDLLNLKVKSRTVEFGDHLDKMLRAKTIMVTTIKMSTDDDSILIELLKFERPKIKSEKAPGPFKIGPTHIAFTVDNLEKVYQKLLANGTKFNCPPIIPPNGKVKVTFCKDPDGTLIELVEELKKITKKGGRKSYEKYSNSSC